MPCRTNWALFAYDYDILWPHECTQEVDWKIVGVQLSACSECRLTVSLASNCSEYCVVLLMLLMNYRTGAHLWVLALLSGWKMGRWCKGRSKEVQIAWALEGGDQNRQWSYAVSSALTPVLLWMRTSSRKYTSGKSLRLTCCFLHVFLAHVVINKGEDRRRLGDGKVGPKREIQREGAS